MHQKTARSPDHGNLSWRAGVEGDMGLFRRSRLLLAGLAIFSVSAGAFGQQKASQDHPTVEQIIDRYVAAIGGRASVERFKSRGSLGTIEVAGMGLSGTVMIHQKAPDKVLQVVVFSGNAFRQAFDGKVGWSDDPVDGLRLLTGVELAEAKRDADFYYDLHFEQIYGTLRFIGTEQIANHLAYVVEGRRPDESNADKLYFDAKSGLILRVVGHRHQADREADLQEDFEDYRDVDGVQMPFIIRQSGGSADFTIHLTQVSNGPDLDDSEFAMPQAGQSAVQ